MSEQHNHSREENGPASPGRRAFLTAGLLAAPLMVPGVAALAQTAAPAAVGNGPYPTRAYGARNKTDGAVPMQIERRALLPDDVLLDILYCAICHSDIHHVYDDWGRQVYPTVPGHDHWTGRSGRQCGDQVQSGRYWRRRGSGGFLPHLCELRRRSRAHLCQRCYHYVRFA
jgi:Alcohol dehydrogenase GroES-like domain